MNDPLVGVVTPVFDTEEHLDACIESVRRQTYENWRYVVFDNQSTDASLRIAERHAAEDPRIRVVRSDRHRPQLENYNCALEEVREDVAYVTIVQADDWLFESCLEELVRTARSGENVGLVGCYRVMGADVMCQGIPYEGRPDGARHSVVPGRVPCRLWLLEDRNVFGSPTGMLYRREILEGLDPFFLPGSYPLADAEVAFRSLREFDYGFVHHVLGFIRPLDEDSISRKVWRTYAPEMLNRVLLTEKYGADYLSEEELERCRAEAWSEYRADLAKSVLLRRSDDEFWDYHRRQLATIGRDVSLPLLVRGFGELVANGMARFMSRIASLFFRRFEAQRA